jgi:hypothetical protein
MKGKWEGSGTFTTSGPDMGPALQVGGLIGAAIGAALIVAAFAWLIITLAVVAVAARLYLLHRRNVAIAAIGAKGALMREEQRASAAARLTAQRAHELEVARVGAPVIHNHIDMAAIAAALFGTQPQPWPEPQPQPIRVKAEIVKPEMPR